MKRLFTVIPVLAVLMISTIGVVYALYGEFNSANNDSDVRYTTITPQGVETTDGLFDNVLEFNTRVSVTDSTRTVTYTLDPSQVTEITVAAVDHDVVLLGETLLRVEQTGGNDDYDLIMNNTSGTMTGTFYAAISTSEDNDTYSAWTYSGYTIGTGVTFADIDSDVEYIKLRLYVESSFQTDNGPLATMPLQNVTFLIKAEHD